MYLRQIKASVAVLALALAACGPFPRDVAGTSEQVRRNGIVRVAFAKLDDAEESVAADFAARAAVAAGARVQMEPSAPVERLFARLEEGEVDLVVAEVATDSPWLPEVAVLEPLASRREGRRELTLSPVARNGENRWIGLLEATARDMGARR
jgi:hypothetical protein